MLGLGLNINKTKSVGGGGGSMWENYPSSPDTVEDFPFQVIWVHSDGNTYLAEVPGGANLVYTSYANFWRFLLTHPSSQTNKRYVLTDETWVLSADGGNYYFNLADRYSNNWEFKEANVNVYTDTGGGTIDFAKTT